MIAKEVDFVENNLGKFPNIFFSMSKITDIKTFGEFLLEFEKIISEVYWEHKYLLNHIKNPKKYERF